MHRCLIGLTVALLLLTTLSASAGSPAPGPFSTTGYTTNLVPSENPSLPPLVPSEFEFLPGGYIKFHIRAQGGPLYYDDPLCQQFYGVTSCDELCSPLGETCGAHGYFEGSFGFDEWAILDPTFAGANDGLLTVESKSGIAEMRFGGSAATTVGGNFQIVGGSGAYKKLAGVGTYTGNSGYVFKVDYTPCGGDDQPRCPKPNCVAYEEALNLRGAEARWDLVNSGQQPVVLDGLLLFWPDAANGALTSVSLDGKTVASGAWSSESQPALVDLTNAPAGLLKIQGAQRSTLTLKFEHEGISEQTADYTFQAEFAEGCSAIHVAFPEQ